MKILKNQDFLNELTNQHIDIFQAIRDNNIEKVKEYLDRGEDVNVQNKYGWTPLYRASHDNHIEVVKLLLQRKDIDLTIKTKKVKTALDIAKEEGHQEIIELLSVGSRIKRQLKDVSVNVDRSGIF